MEEGGCGVEEGSSAWRWGWEGHDTVETSLLTRESAQKAPVFTLKRRFWRVDAVLRRVDVGLRLVLGAIFRLFRLRRRF